MRLGKERERERWRQQERQESQHPAADRQDSEGLTFLPLRNTPSLSCYRAVMTHQVSSPFLKPFFLKNPVCSLTQRRHTLPASEFRNLTPQDAISVFEIEREGKSRFFLCN